MTREGNIISSILKDLTNVHENLISLSNDIWSSIDHNNTVNLEKGYQFKKEFNRLLEEFEQNKDSICALVSQFTGVQIDGRIKIVNKEDSENQRIIRELDKDEPHEVTEDFTFKRPTAFIFNNCAYTDLHSWVDFFVQFVSCAAKLNPSKLKEMADMPEFISKQDRKYYSADKKNLRKPIKIMNDFYVETNLSANEFAKRIIEIINHFGMKNSDITIYLWQGQERITTAKYIKI